jgi:hypothetical protein
MQIRSRSTDNEDSSLYYKGIFKLTLNPPVDLSEVHHNVKVPLSLKLVHASIPFTVRNITNNTDYWIKALQTGTAILVSQYTFQAGTYDSLGVQNAIFSWQDANPTLFDTDYTQVSINRYACYLTGNRNVNKFYLRNNTNAASTHPTIDYDFELSPALGALLGFTTLLVESGITHQAELDAPLTDSIQNFYIEVDGINTNSYSKVGNEGSYTTLRSIIHTDSFDVSAGSVKNITNLETEPVIIQSEKLSNLTIYIKDSNTNEILDLVSYPAEILLNIS